MQNAAHSKPQHGKGWTTVLQLSIKVHTSNTANWKQCIHILSLNKFKHSLIDNEHETECHIFAVFFKFTH